MPDEVKLEPCPEDDGRTASTFRVEMTEGQLQRQVDADSFTVHDGWLIFYRRSVEYWRANMAKVVSMETCRNAKRA